MTGTSTPAHPRRSSITISKNSEHTEELPKYPPFSEMRSRANVRAGEQLSPESCQLLVSHVKTWYYNSSHHEKVAGVGSQSIGTTRSLHLQSSGMFKRSSAQGMSHDWDINKTSPPLEIFHNSSPRAEIARELPKYSLQCETEQNEHPRPGAAVTGVRSSKRRLPR